MTRKKFSIKDRIKSFEYAFRGLLLFFKEEHNARIHFELAIIAILLAYALQISIIEWIAVILCIILVFAAELINTAIERLCDKIEPNLDSDIAEIKNLAAAAVLIISIGVAIVGILIFLPKMI